MIDYVTLLCFSVVTTVHTGGGGRDILFINERVV